MSVKTALKRGGSATDDPLGPAAPGLLFLEPLAIAVRRSVVHVGVSSCLTHVCRDVVSTGVRGVKVGA